MLRNFPVALAAGGMILVAGLVGASEGHAASRSFAVSGFDRIQSSVPFDIRVHTGAAPSVRAVGPQQAIDGLSIDVQGGQLTIRNKARRWWGGWNWSRERATIEIAVPTLSAATLSGPGDMAIDRVTGRSFTATLNGPGDLSLASVDAGDLTLVISGPGDVTASGRANSARITLHGPGDVRARTLTVRDATINLSGPGDVAITASGTATGSLNGPGDIVVDGGARCTISKHGPGDVTCR